MEKQASLTLKENLSITTTTTCEPKRAKRGELSEMAKWALNQFYFDLYDRGLSRIDLHRKYRGQCHINTIDNALKILLVRELIQLCVLRCGYHGTSKRWKISEKGISFYELNIQNEHKS